MSMRWFYVDAMRLSFETTLSVPTEDFGRMNQHFRLHFRSTFQGCEYRIWATKRWKVLRKCSLKCLFVLPSDASMIVWWFLCNNIARMGLQKTTKMRAACVQSDAFFVTTLQRWVYKTRQHERDVWCIMIVSCFLCGNIRLCLQTTKLPGWV